MTKIRHDDRRSLPVVLPGGIVVVAVGVRQQNRRRLWTATNGSVWIEPC